MEQLKAYIEREPDDRVNTKGVFSYGEFQCKTLELAYFDNKRGVSCYPTGTYICKKVGATKAIPYPHIWVTNVPNRDGICIHIANYVGVKKSDVRGCTAVGSGYSDINKDGVIDIVNSKATFEKLMQAVPDEFVLVVK